MSVREIAVIKNDLLLELAVAYPAFAAIEAEIEHVPASTKATSPELEFTVQIGVVELV